MGFSPSRAVADGEYFMARAEAEIALADAAKSPRAAEAHHKLASEYIDRMFGDEGSGSSSSQTETEQEKRLAIASAFLQLRHGPWRGGSLPDATWSELLAHMSEG